MTDNLEISETLRLLHAQETLPPADQLKRLWEIPEKVPEDFRIPEGVRLALASGSDFKQKNVTEVWNSLGGQGIIVTKSEDESMIQAFLAQRHKLKNSINDNTGSPDIYRVLDIASLKAGLVSDETLGKIGATHVMGLDVDVAAWPDEDPMGTPQNEEELRRNLQRMQGKTITINVAGAMRKVGSQNLSSERVHITLPIRQFDIKKYLEELGMGAVGRVAGGVDFSDPRSFDLLGAGPVMVDRELHFGPNFAPETQLLRTIVVNGDDRPKLLGEMGDYFKGAPREMVKWVLYDGIGKNSATV